MPTRVNPNSGAAGRATALVLAMLALGSCTMGQHVRSSSAMPRSYAISSTPGIRDEEAPILVYRPVEPSEAVQLNAAIPVSTQPLVSARAFMFSAASGMEPVHAAAVDCLTAAIYYEASSESEQGQRAVAQVVLNRMRHPAFPKSVCGVVFQGAERKTGCQFTFTCDGSLSRLPRADAWDRARRFAEQALAGHVEKSVGLSTHYHTVWVVPYWRDDLTKLAVIGAHIFYRWTGSWGTKTAFRGEYAATEALPAKLASSLPQFLLSTSGDDPVSPADNSGAEGSADLARATLTTPTGWAVPSVATLPKPQHILAADATHSVLLADERRGTLARD